MQAIGRDNVPKKRVKIFNELKEALEDVRGYRLGKRTDLRVTELPAPPKNLAPAEIRRIRRSLKASQAKFALYLNVSPNAVRSWEQGTRRPQHAALKLLAIAKRNPQALLGA
jgi:putative transcriptional regulator